MCFAYGSLDQATSICSMCKVFKPSGRCPHVREVCRNRINHPRHDVVYLKNAEVQSFNGCGYCKWAATNPPTKLAGYQNPGWPGCCRPPTPSEYRMIKIADWPTVSSVHHISMPPDIKAVLDSFSSKTSSTPTGSVRGLSGQSYLPPLLDRRNSANTGYLNKGSGKTSTMTIPSKGRRGGSPPETASSLAGVGPLSTSVPTSSSMENRRPAPSEPSERHIEAPHSSHSSPSRKNIDLEATTSRRKSAGRPSIAAIMPSASVTKVTVDAQAQTSLSQLSLRRRASVSSTNPPSIKPSSPNARPAADHPSPSVTARTPKNTDEMSSASSSSSGSDGPGSMTDSTDTLDGGFTDYLSDESEAELQRQAEAKAALVAQNQMEELEFRAARQQLAHVDLRPPKSWNPNLSKETSPRFLGSTAHTASYHTTTPFANPPFSTGPMAYTGPSARG